MNISETLARLQQGVKSSLDLLQGCDKVVRGVFHFNKALFDLSSRFRAN
jgi:hypothetical protein